MQHISFCSPSTKARHNKVELRKHGFYNLSNKPDVLVFEERISQVLGKDVLGDECETLS